jgi:D-alanyl-D-alanine carboxypeptidase
LHFEPGSQWEYSNTNFVLLGLVIEAASNESYESLIETRLTVPLGLNDTYIAASGDSNLAIVDCYDRDGTNLTDTADPSFGWAAGAGVSTPADLARWTAALYGGDVLSDDALERMLTPTELSDGTLVESGLGAFVEIDGEDAIYGHTGGIAGYLTYMYFWQADRIALVAMTNTFDTNLRDLSAYGWSVPLGFVYP